MRSAAAGSLIGIGEIVLLPLDVLKIKRQTNPESFKGRGFIKILRDEGLFNLYRGWGGRLPEMLPVHSPFLVVMHSPRSISWV